MPAEPTVALVFSPEPWVEQLHRFLADHGGARVRQIVVDPSVALDDDYEVLVVSDRWPSLTRSFVERLHTAGRRVLGVFDPEEPAGKEHLVAVGADAMLPADTPADEFVAALHQLAAPEPRAEGDAAVERRCPSNAVSPSVPGRCPMVLVGGARGSGRTEVAVALAGHLAAREPVLLVDALVDAPAMSVRLGLAIEPNLRSAVDEVAYGSGALNRCAAPIGGSGLAVLGGFPSPAAAAQVAARDVLDVVAAARVEYRSVVVEADGTIADALLVEDPVVVAVLAPTPVGVARGLAWIAEVRASVPSVPVHLVVNRAPRERFRRAELTTELTRTFVPASLTFVPVDRRVEQAAWAGALVGPGPFSDAVAGLAASLRGGGSRRERRARGRRRSRR